MHEHGSASRRPSAASLRPTAVRTPADRAPGRQPGAHGHSGTRRDAGAPAVLAASAVPTPLDDTRRALLRAAVAVLRASAHAPPGIRRVRADPDLVRAACGD
ncbi:hypothetical protein, partial [Streptomyces sp. SID14446]|uniref:hypothetical protein n=1 Tax=Streptomyces sp. SID14446 TaxID=2706072 RepID=UPI001944CF71